MAETKISSVFYKNKIPNKVLYGFSLGSFGKDLMYAMTSIFLMKYFTDILKVNPLFVGTMMFVAKLWDAINDLIMGVIVDNTKSKFGKFVPWLALGIPLNIVVFILLFTDFHLSGTSLCIFAAVMYTLWGMCYTVMDIPYWSLVPSLTSNPVERAKISVIPAIFASVSKSLIVGAFGVYIIDILGSGYKGYHNFALIITAIFTVTFAICTLSLPKAQTTNSKKELINFKEVLSIIKQNDQLRCTIGLILLYNVGVQFIRGVATYYFAYVCCNKGLQFVFMTSACIAEIFGLLVFPKITKYLPQKKVFFLSCILPAIGLLLLLTVSFVCPTNAILTAISGIIVQLGNGLERGCTTVCLADVVDYGEHTIGTRNEGIVFSLQALSKKFTSALMSFSIGYALKLTGYVPNIAQSLSTKNSIRVLMCIIPAVGMLLAYVVYKTKYKLNSEFMQKILTKIEGQELSVNSENLTQKNCNAAPIAPITNGNITETNNI